MTEERKDRAAWKKGDIQTLTAAEADRIVKELKNEQAETDKWLEEQDRKEKQS